MNKHIKKLLCAAVSLAMVAGTIVLPAATASAADYSTWKFRFGAEGASVGADEILVKPDVNVTANPGTATAKAITKDEEGHDVQNTVTYGFIGTNEKDYRLAGGRIDGFVQQQGQIIDLQAGTNGIGSNGVTNKEQITTFNDGDYYPTRFAMKVPDDTYYKVKVTVKRYDNNSEATASLYTERKHPLYTQKAVPETEGITTEFTVRPTPIYYEKSNPTGTIADNFLTVSLLGDNTALYSVEVTQVESAPVLWILGDSTVTDGGGDLPFWPYKQCTGVGTGVTKYIPKDIAVVNAGEGGLNAADNNHFNIVKTRIKAGDYMWVEYGHNHKNDGADGYYNNLQKYLDACNSAQGGAANLIIVSPIERTNTFSGGEYKHSLDSFATKGLQFVTEKKTAGATNVAYVDLNQPSLDFYNSIVTKNSGSADAAGFYFNKGKKGGFDSTHPNDLGAENLAYLLFTDAKKKATDYPLLSGLTANMSEEQPVKVPADIIAEPVPYTSWPTYQGTGVAAEHPLEVTRVNINDKNQITSLVAKVLDVSQMESYAAGFVEIGGNKYQTTIASHLDYSAASNGSSYVLLFDSDNLPQLQSRNDTFKAYMWPVDMAANDKPLEGEATAYSADYTEPDYVYLIPGQGNEQMEDFDYYGYTTLTGDGSWTYVGSNGTDFTLGEESGKKYSTVKATGSGGSYNLRHELKNLIDAHMNSGNVEIDNVGTGSTGRYVFDVDMKYVSGNTVFKLYENTNKNSPYYSGEGLDMFTISTGGAVTINGKSVGTISTTDWTKLHYELDMDAGKVTAYVGESNSASPVSVDIPQYQKFDKPTINTLRYLWITTTANNGTFEIKMSNLQFMQDNVSDRYKSTLTVEADEGESVEAGTYGSVHIGDGTDTTKEVNAGDELKAVAVPTADGRFMGWYIDGQLYSVDEEISLRMYKTANAVAKFAQQTPATNVTINFKDEAGNTVKDPVTLTANSLGQELHEQMSYTLDDSYKAFVKKASTTYTGEYDVYTFKSADKETIASLEEAGTNVINLTFEHGVYFDYEDFSAVTDKWGFTEGKSGNVAVANGELKLLVNAGTSAQGSDVKTITGNIATAKKITVVFDYRGDMPTNNASRYSTFNFKNGDKYIFSMNASGSSGIHYGVNEKATNSSANKVADTSDQWVSVKVSIDFDAQTLSGTIVNKSTNQTYTIPSTAITATGLDTLTGEYGYSTGAFRIDNIGFRDDDPQLPPSGKIILEDGAFTVDTAGVATATVKNDKAANADIMVISASYVNGALESVKTKTETLASREEKTITTEALTGATGTIRAYVWDMTGNACQPVAAAPATPPTTP